MKHNDIKGFIVADMQNEKDNFEKMKLDFPFERKCFAHDCFEEFTYEWHPKNVVRRFFLKLIGEGYNIFRVNPLRYCDKHYSRIKEGKWEPAKKEDFVRLSTKPMAKVEPEIEDLPNQLLPHGRKGQEWEYGRELFFCSDELNNICTVSESINQNPKLPFMKELQLYVFNEPCNYINLNAKALIALRNVIDAKLKRNKNPQKFIDVDKIRYEKGLCKHKNCFSRREGGSAFCKKCVQMNANECNFCEKPKEAHEKGEGK